MSNMNYNNEGVVGKIDPTDGTTIYVGYPAPGTTSEASANWAIKRITIDAVSGIVTEQWVNGSSICSYKWCNRSSYTYSFLK